MYKETNFNIPSMISQAVMLVAAFRQVPINKPRPLTFSPVISISQSIILISFYRNTHCNWDSVFMLYEKQTVIWKQSEVKSPGKNCKRQGGLNSRHILPSLMNEVHKMSTSWCCVFESRPRVSSLKLSKVSHRI
jgi:hypothetical protein